MLVVMVVFAATECQQGTNFFPTGSSPTLGINLLPTGSSPKQSRYPVFPAIFVQSGGGKRPFVKFTGGVELKSEKNGCG